MAIGTTAAIIGSAAIGAGASIASSRAQSSAARQASQTAQQTTADNNATARYIFDQQTALNEPFRQSDLARRRIGDSFFGIEAIAPQAGGGGTNAVPNVNALMAGQYGQVNQPVNRSPMMFDRDTGRPFDDGNRAAVNALMMRQSFPELSAANMGGHAAANLAANKLPVQDTNVPATIPLNSDAPATTSATANLFDPSLPGASNFNNSVFNPLAQTMFNQERDRIDANLAASGLLYDGVRQTAVQEAGNRSAQNALSLYFNALNGAPMSQATNNLTTAAGNYGANVMANNTAGANAIMAAQQARGQANADMWGGIGTAAGYGMGAFDWGGSGSAGYKPKPKFGF